MPTDIARSVTPPASRRYFAFISYSHDGASAEESDAGIAEWLQRALERYSVPKALVGRQTASGIVPRSLGHVFRDSDYLPAGPELAPLIENALANSDNLIVICSPRAVASQWVSREIVRFKQLRASEIAGPGNRRRVFGLLVDGTPTESFPNALIRSVDATGMFVEPQVEPFAPDVRKDGRDGAFLRLIAGLLDLDLEDIVAREEARRRAQRRRSVLLFSTGLFLTVLASVGIIGAAVLGWRNAGARADLLAGFASQSLSDRRPDEALLFALAASPAATGDVLPFRPRAHHALTTATLQSENTLAIAKAHEQDVASAEADSAVATVLTSSIDGTIRGTDLHTGREVTRMNAGKPVWRATRSRDGRYIVAMTYDGTALIWHERSPKPAFVSAHSGPVALQFSDDGRFLLIAWRDRIAIHRSTDLAAEWSQLDGSISAAALSPTAAVIAIAHDDGALQLVDRTRARPPMHIAAHEASVSRIRFSSDGERLVTASLDRSAALIEVSSGKILARMRASGPVLAAEFSRDGRRIATSSTDGSVQVWDGVTGSELLFFPTNAGWTSAVALSPDGRLLAAGSRNAAVRVIDTEGRDLLTLHGHSGEVTYVAFSPDSRTLLSVSVDGGVRLWDTARHGVACEVSFDRASVRAVAVARGGNRIGVLLNSGSVQVLRLPRCDVSPPVPFASTSQSQFFAHEGFGFVARAGDGSVQVWDMDRDQPEARINNVPRDAELALSEDGATLAARRGDHVQLWSVRHPGRLLARVELRATTGPVAVGSRWLAAAAEPRSILLVDLRDVTKTLKVILPARVAGPLRFSTEGAVISAPLEDGSAVVWQIGSNTAPRRFAIDDRRILDAIPDSKEWVIHIATSPPRVVQMTMANFETIAEVPLPAATGRVTLAPRQRWIVETNGAGNGLVVRRMLPGGLDLVRYACSIVPPGGRSLSAKAAARAAGVLRTGDRFPCARRKVFDGLRPLTRLFDESYYGY